MSWYVIFVETGREDDFCQYADKVRNQRFAGIEFNLLVPKRKIYERKQGIRREVVKQLFPGYVLLETESISEFFFMAKNCPHVIRFLRDNSCFLKVRREEIEQILRMMDYRGLIEISKAFMEDGRIRITNGPLLGREDVIKKIDKRKGRAKVGFNLNGKAFLIDLGIVF